MSRLSRRGIMGGAAALIPTVVAVPAAAMPGSDAQLIAACTRFCSIEREWRTICNAAGRLDYDDPENARLEAEADHIRAGQEPFLDAIVELPCTTLAGAQALAEALTEWDQDLFHPRHTDTSRLLTVQLVRAVLAMGGPAGCDNDRPPEAMVAAGWRS